MRELLRLYTEEQLIRYARSIGMSEGTIRYYMRCVRNGTVAREHKPSFGCGARTFRHSGLPFSCCAAVIPIDSLHAACVSPLEVGPDSPCVIAVTDADRYRMPNVGKDHGLYKEHWPRLAADWLSLVEPNT